MTDSNNEHFFDALSSAVADSKHEEEEDYMTTETVLAIRKLVAEWAAVATLVKPEVQQVIGLVKSYGPELNSLMEDVSTALVANRIRVFKQYTEAGFSREEALLLMIDSRAAMQTAVQNVKLSK